jgi:hypothetical protein
MEGGREAALFLCPVVSNDPLDGPTGNLGMRNHLLGIPGSRVAPAPRKDEYGAAASQGPFNANNPSRTIR